MDSSSDPTVKVEEPPATGGDGDAVTKMLQDPAAFAAALHEVEQQRMEEFLADLPAPVKRRIKALKKLQMDAIQIEMNFYERVHELECEFAQKFQPIYNKRRDIVTGKYEPTDTEADFPLIGVAELAKELESKVTVQNGPEAVKEEGQGVPGFWLAVFKHVDLVTEMIQEHDEPILSHLTDVEVKLRESGPPGFTLYFHFSPNEYFTESVLTKDYTLRFRPPDEEAFEFEGPEVVDCAGFKISWKSPEKNVTMKLIKKKQKHKAKGQTRFITKQVKNDSFFNFFDPPKVPETGADSLEEETRDLLNADFELGQVFRDRVIPRAVLYYTGEAHDDTFDEDEEEEDDEDEDEDEDDDDGHHQGEDAEKKKNQKPEECKQQ